MRTNHTKERLGRGEPVLVTTLHFTDPSLFELVSLLGFDAIWMDLEHHGYSVETAAGLMRAARVGSADILARPARGELMRMGRLLEAGAGGIIYPRCAGPDEAEQVVRWSKFAPRGCRGIDGANPDMPYLSMPLEKYLAEANRQTLIVIQLEEQSAVDQAEGIAAVDGVDVLMLGPGDFSILEGFPGQWDHPRIETAMRTIAEAARRTGKQWGGPCFSAEHARKMLDMGARFLCHSADILIVKEGFERIQRDFAPLGFKFNNRLVSA